MTEVLQPLFVPVSDNIVLKIPIVWSVTQCTWYTCSTRFGRYLCIHYQGIHSP